MGLSNGFKGKCDSCGEKKMVYPNADGEKLCEKCLKNRKL